MTLRVVHLSKSSLAGQPHRLVKALQRYTNYDVRMVDLHRWNIYSHDLIFTEELEKCVELVQNADIVHFHNYLDLNSTSFAPLDFKDLHAKGKAFIRQIHSEPNALSRIMGISVNEVLSCDLPTLVIAQYPERFFPNARVVPNNIPIDALDYIPTRDSTYWDLFFSPTKAISAWEDRWNTKGTPETLYMMEKIAGETGCLTKSITQRPLSEVLYEKRRSYIVLDDMITGSYHLSGLEGLSMAKPTLAYLDERIRRVLLDVSGASTIPFINTQLENANVIIKYFLQHRDEGSEIGQSGRQWLEQYWSEESIIQHYKDIYEKLLYDPSLICRQKSLQIDNKTQQFFALTLPDLNYQSHKDRATNLHYIISEFFRVANLKSRKLWLSIKKSKSFLSLRLLLWPIWRIIKGR